VNNRENEGGEVCILHIRKSFIFGTAKGFQHVSRKIHTQMLPEGWIQGPPNVRPRFYLKTAKSHDKTQSRISKRQVSCFNPLQISMTQVLIIFIRLQNLHCHGGDNRAQFLETEMQIS
jgi:hypothetical protein